MSSSKSKVAAGETQSTLLLLQISFITVAAAAAAYYAIGSVNLSDIHSANWTDADLIRHRCPIRLIQPEWVSSQPDRLMNWPRTETLARLSVIAALWLGGLVIFVWDFLETRKDSRAA